MSAAILMPGTWEHHLAFEEPGGMLVSHGQRYPTVATALDCLEWLADHDHVVLGFEGIDTDGRFLRPRIDRIADFSSIDGPWEERVRASVEATRRVLTEWLGDVQFVDLNVAAPDPGPGTLAQVTLPPADAWDQVEWYGGLRGLKVCEAVLWPTIVREGELYLLEGRYDATTLAGWRASCPDEPGRIESVVNHVHLWDLDTVDERIPGLTEPEKEQLAEALARSWRLAAVAQFPGVPFLVEVTTEAEGGYGPEVTVWVDRTGESS